LDLLGLELLQLSQRLLGVGLTTLDPLGEDFVPALDHSRIDLVGLGSCLLLGLDSSLLGGLGDSLLLEGHESLELGRHLLGVPLDLLDRLVKELCPGLGNLGGLVRLGLRSRQLLRVSRCLAGSLLGISDLRLQLLEGLVLAKLTDESLAGLILSLPDKIKLILLGRLELSLGYAALLHLDPLLAPGGDLLRKIANCCQSVLLVDLLAERLKLSVHVLCHIRLSCCCLSVDCLLLNPRNRFQFFGIAYLESTFF